MKRSLSFGQDEWCSKSGSSWLRGLNSDPYEMEDPGKSFMTLPRLCWYAVRMAWLCSHAAVVQLKMKGCRVGAGHSVLQRDSSNWTNIDFPGGIGEGKG